MSVDLGSEFIKIGLVKPGVPMEIVLNRESNRKTASIVGIRNSDRAFGDPAAQMAIKYPANSFRYLNDLLGKSLEHEVVRTYMKRFPHHHLVEDDTRGTVLFQDESGEKHSVEELIAMLLSEARSLAEKYAEQPVRDVVVTVPPYFNQAERRALHLAADIAGLSLLQLINDNTAAGINYGMFRRKEFNDTAVIIMIYDMGATKTTATLFEYQLVKAKDARELDPQMTVLGVGFDRTLGGLELTYRLRDHLADEFMKQGKVKNDVRKNARAMAKLHKEAERLKQVLSANQDHYAQIENLMEDTDFRHKVTRQLMEDMCVDIFERVGNPIKDALDMAELNMDQVQTVIMMGGGTRVPKVQEKLQSVIGQKELGKYLNTDEAIALGAVYQAAHLSKGFKVKKFTVKEATLFPITVDFKKEGPSSQDEKVRRTLFARKNPFPQRKVMTFSKHKNDFDFFVNYGDMKFLSKPQLEHLGYLNISRVEVSGLTNSLKANTDPSFDYKGAKVHFVLDESGIISVANAESWFERSVDEKEESTLSKLGSKLSSFFGGGSDKAGEKGETRPADEATAPNSTDSKNEDSTKDLPKEAPSGSESDSKSSGSKTDTAGQDIESKTANNSAKSQKQGSNNTVPTQKTIRNKLTVKVTCLDVPNATDVFISESRKKLKTFEQREQVRRARDEAHNALESFLFDTADRLSSDDVLVSVSSEEERTRIRGQLQKTQDWLDEQGHATSALEFEEKLSALKSVCKDVFFKVQEQKERPKAIEAMKSILNYSSVFLAGMKNLTEDMQIFSEVEMNTLEKAVNETAKWWTEKELEQQKLQPHEKPAFTLQAVAEKVNALDREVKYLLNKAKYAKPKPKKPPTDSNSNKTETENIPQPESANETSEPDKDEERIGEETAEETASREAEESQSSDSEAEISEDQGEPADAENKQANKPGSHEDL